MPPKSGEIGRNQSLKSASLIVMWANNACLTLQTYASLSKDKAFSDEAT